MQQVLRFCSYVLVVCLIIRKRVDLRVFPLAFEHVVMSGFSKAFQQLLTLHVCSSKCHVKERLCETEGLLGTRNAVIIYFMLFSLKREKFQRFFFTLLYFQDSKDRGGVVEISFAQTSPGGGVIWWC